MSGSPTRLERLFGALARRRLALPLALAWLALPLALAWLALAAPAAWLATRVQQDNSPDRLIVESDPDYRALLEFERVFPDAGYVFLLAEAPDPFAPPTLDALDRLERALAAVPGVSPQSALATFRRMRAGFVATPEQSAALRRFVLGTDEFRRQGLVGARFLGVPLLLDAPRGPARERALSQLDAIVVRARAEAIAAGSLTALRSVGEPYVARYLDAQTRRGAWLDVALFALFVIALVLALYRSARTLAAFLLVLAVGAAVSMGIVGALGGRFTIVSSLAPMTILVVATATLVYLHARYVERDPSRTDEAQLAFALANKFVPCTASTLATAAGFAALAISRIRPIREMGLWTAAGLAVTWLTAFTLFPALELLLRTPPKRAGARPGADRFARFAAALPSLTRHLRWPLVASALVLCAVGAVALAGVPGLLAPMRIETQGIEYVDHRAPLYRDTRRLEEAGIGLALTDVWLASDRFGRVTDADAERALDELQRALEADPRFRSVAGPSTILRLLAYQGGAPDRLPDDDDALERLISLVETQLPIDPAIQRFLEPRQMAQAHLVVTTQAVDWAGFREVESALRRHYDEAAARHPALRDFHLRAVGSAPLQAKTVHQLVPTLVESLALTAAIILVTFLVVFPSAAARLLAMIPSLFAILVMFAVMRVAGMRLNVATILIATTVLGTSQNDQIHFFFHFLEARTESGVGGALEHALRVAGRAILFATLINAGGFLAFALSSLPPIRQFGLLSSLALALSMLADFSALPAALWLVLRDRPATRARSRPRLQSSHLPNPH